MFSSWRRSKSSLRADAAEAERAMLREKLQAMQFTNASATQSTETTARPKSASSIRADAAEAELAKLRSQMQAKHKKKFLKFSCKIGWCTHEGTCDSVDADLELLKKRLTAMELEMEQLQRFSEIRNEMERKIAKVEKEIRSKYGILNALELVIVMDCTNSMSSWILLAKSAILSIINNVRLDHPRAKIRIGVVAYRDFCDGDKRLQTQTLTSDATVVQNFISSLRAFGGGDDPEDIPGGLAAALAMPFQAEAKRIVLVTDAPCHGRKFHDTSDKEEYRSEIEQSPDICAQMREMARRGIDFTIIEVYPPNTAKMTDVEMQIVAKRLAIEFSLCEAVEYGVDFVSTCWYEIKNPATAGLSPSTSMFTAEPYIDGKYKKYNNNNGWISDDGLNLSETAQAFSHFTWQKTYGELMVVDLQGVGRVFTDPQIHSTHGDKFGCGNLSDAGMTAFFATHECNSVCRALKLTPVKHTESDADADTVLDVADKNSTKRAAKKWMTFSCPLCGEITLVLRSAFIKAYRGERELYCKCCVSKGKNRLRRKCSTCKKKFDYSPYWFSMKGIEIPTSCKNCEAAATKNGAE
ncbi:hypothetical protein PF005_g12025 [Phytophthora fragariae]|uniref:Alpha-type protein kinase domain-containing protein n=1 Tax=Phytophthora fragariae TaxID=53985 RepID=A0A6A3Y2N4_9STRA|nr:hypothetical protein PF005_g12025 [Phytophthora fragariae]